MEYTEEQKSKLKVLHNKYKWISLKVALKNIGIFAVLTVVTVLVDAFLFKPVSQGFAFVVGMVNGIVFFKLQRADYLEIEKEAIEDIKKILEE